MIHPRATHVYALHSRIVLSRKDDHQMRELDGIDGIPVRNYLTG